MGQPEQNGVPARDLEEDAIPNESGTIDPIEPHDAEKLKNIRNSQPGHQDSVGRDTVGPGQPDAQKVEQEESLPAASVPVEKNFTRNNEFYDPMNDERAIADKEVGNRGGAKAE